MGCGRRGKDGSDTEQSTSGVFRRELSYSLHVTDVVTHHAASTHHSVTNVHNLASILK
jgi:hypothetical protein